MKRITKYNLVNLILLITYIAIIIVQSATNVFLMDTRFFWFMAFCCFVGVSLIFKFLIFKSDSSLWFGATLISVAITICLFYYYNLKYEQFYASFLISPIIGSLFVGLIFKDVLQLKMIIYILCFMVPLYLLNFSIINWYVCVIIIVTLIIMCVFLLNFLPKILFKLKNRKS